MGGDTFGSSDRNDRTGGIGGDSFGSSNRMGGSDDYSSGGRSGGLGGSDSYNDSSSGGRSGGLGSDSYGSSGRDDMTSGGRSSGYGVREHHILPELSTKECSWASNVLILLLTFFVYLGRRRQYVTSSLRYRQRTWLEFANVFERGKSADDDTGYGNKTSSRTGDYDNSGSSYGGGMSNTDSYSGGTGLGSGTTGGPGKSRA